MELALRREKSTFADYETHITTLPVVAGYPTLWSNLFETFIAIPVNKIITTGCKHYANYLISL